MSVRTCRRQGHVPSSVGLRPTDISRCLIFMRYTEIDHSFMPWWARKEADQHAVHSVSGNGIRCITRRRHVYNLEVELVIPRTQWP